MKYLLLILLFKLSLSFGQFQKTETPKQTVIGKAKSGGVKLSELSYYVMGNDTLYNFTYKDKKFTYSDTWKNVTFKGDSKVLNDLYGTLKAALDSSKGFETSFILGESNFFITTASMLGAKYLKIGIVTTGVASLTDLTEKQLNNLFNKNNENGGD